MAVCKLCPYRKHCWGVGDCGTCDFGKAYNGLDSKIKRLKAKNEALKNENEELKNRIEILENSNFGKEL